MAQDFFVEIGTEELPPKSLKTLATALQQNIVDELTKLGLGFADSQWYADSYKLLQSKGLEPRENSGSWISRAGKKLLGV